MEFSDAVVVATVAPLLVGGSESLRHHPSSKHNEKDICLLYPERQLRYSGCFLGTYKMNGVILIIAPMQVRQLARVVVSEYQPATLNHCCKLCPSIVSLFSSMSYSTFGKLSVLYGKYTENPTSPYDAWSGVVHICLPK